MKPLLLSLALLAGLTAQAQKSDKQPYVYDESYLDPSFVEFKNKLTVAVTTRDIDALAALCADSIRASPEMGYEKPSEWKEWEDLSFIFDKMEQLLRFGFHRTEEGAFQAPSYLRIEDRDFFHEDLIVLGENVNIRAKPCLKAKVIRQASYELFEFHYPMGDGLVATESDYCGEHEYNWQEIVLAKGTVGYVYTPLTSQAIWKELTIKKIDGKWRITSFWNPYGC